jgi:hypothetical protein
VGGVECLLVSEVRDVDVNRDRESGTGERRVR